MCGSRRRTTQIHEDSLHRVYVTEEKKSDCRLQRVNRVRCKTNLQHPGGHDLPHLGNNVLLDALEVVRRRQVVLLGPQHGVQDPVVEQVQVLVGPPDGVHLAAQQLVLHGAGPGLSVGEKRSLCQYPSAEVRPSTLR